mmetsp:Transcript_17156/g.22996  ORF Transcript_17156/g.22996 Transcript_17156/m.22996 type:complete len:184 (-) Transcript_17156:703-1254(-)
MRVLSSYTTSFVVLTATTFMILKSSEAFMTVKSPSSAAFVSLPSTLFPTSHHHDHHHHHSALFSSEQEEAEATVEKEEQTEEEEEGEDDEVPQPKAKSVEDILRDLHTSALPFRIVVRSFCVYFTFCFLFLFLFVLLFLFGCGHFSHLYALYNILSFYCVSLFTLIYISVVHLHTTMHTFAKP